MCQIQISLRVHHQFKRFFTTIWSKEHYIVAELDIFLFLNVNLKQGQFVHRSNAIETDNIHTDHDNEKRVVRKTEKWPFSDKNGSIHKNIFCFTNNGLQTLFCNYKISVIEYRPAYDKKI